MLFLSQILIYFSSNSSFFTKKDIFLVSLKLYIRSHFWKYFSERLNVFIIFVSNKIFKTLLTKGNLVGWQYFIKMYIIYRNWIFVVVKLVFFKFSITKRYIFLILFDLYLRIFYNFIMFHYFLLNRNFSLYFWLHSYLY